MLCKLAEVIEFVEDVEELEEDFFNDFSFFEECEVDGTVVVAGVTVQVLELTTAFLVVVGVAVAAVS